MDTTKETTSIYPWIEGDIEPGSNNIVFHLGRNINIKAHIYSDGTFVIIDSPEHTSCIVNKIFKAFDTPISEDREEIWPSSMYNLSMLKRWKGRHNTPRTTSEEITQSLTNNTKQDVTLELQDQRVDFRRGEIPRGSILCGRITEATISIQPLSYTTISF